MAPAAPVLAKFATGDEQIAHRVTPVGTWNLKPIGSSYDASEPLPQTATEGFEAKWSLFKAAFKRAMSRDQLRYDRREIFAGFDPDILSLRSVSPQHRAYMLVRSARTHKQAEQDAKNKLKVLFGLKKDDDW